MWESVLGLPHATPIPQHTSLHLPHTRVMQLPHKNIFFSKTAEPLSGTVV